MCRSCGADFAKTVKECPHCGKKVQSGMLLMLIIGLGCLALVAAFALPINNGQTDDMKILSEASVDQVNAAELAGVLGGKNSKNDPGIQNKVSELTGKIVQWELEVFVSTKTAGYYQMVTKSTANAPGTLLKVYPQDSQQQNYLERIKPGNTIKIKGKISGFQQGRIKIDPAMII
jgi:hypothetical protein